MLAYPAVLTLLGTGGYVVSQAPASEPTIPAVRTVTATRTVTVQGRYRHRTARSWARGYHRRGALIRHERHKTSRARRTLAAVARQPVYGHSTLENAFLCIHGYEGSWTDGGEPYFGGLQMDDSFMARYGGWAVRAFGTADHWPVVVQISVAIEAYESGRGFYPWPNTARYCGLL